MSRPYMKLHNSVKSLMGKHRLMPRRSARLIFPAILRVTSSIRENVKCHHKISPYYLLSFSRSCDTRRGDLGGPRPDRLPPRRSPRPPPRRRPRSPSCRRIRSPLCKKFDVFHVWLLRCSCVDQLFFAGLPAKLIFHQICLI